MTAQTTSIGMLFARLSWMIFGPLGLFLLISAILRTGEGWLTTADIAYFGVLAGMVLCRIVEFRGGAAITAEGEPMTAAVLWRYVAVTLALGVGAWVVANLFANQVFSRM